MTRKMIISFEIPDTEIPQDYVDFLRRYGIKVLTVEVKQEGYIVVDCAGGCGRHLQTPAEVVPKEDWYCPHCLEEAARKNDPEQYWEANK